MCLFRSVQNTYITAVKYILQPIELLQHNIIKYQIFTLGERFNTPTIIIARFLNIINLFCWWVLGSRGAFFYLNWSCSIGNVHYFIFILYLLLPESLDIFKHFQTSVDLVSTKFLFEKAEYFLLQHTTYITFCISLKSWNVLIEDSYIAGLC